MKYARSILLGEDVDADEVDHGDTVGFQIVCPCCSESVIKVCRPLDGDRTAEFFSHRQGDPERNAECEMRVASLSRQERAVWSAQERRQTMDAFRSVLTSVLEVDLEARGIRDHKRSYRKLTEAGMFPVFVDALSKNWRNDLARRQDASLRMDPVVRALTLSEDRFDKATRNPFPARVANRCVTDLWAHLSTEQGRLAFQRLFGHAVMCVTAGVHQVVRRERLPIGGVCFPPIDHRAMLKAVWHPNPRKAAMSVQLAARSSDPHSRQNLDQLFIRTVELEMANVLERLPYLKILDNYRNGLPMTSGLETVYVRRAKSHEQRMRQMPPKVSSEVEALGKRMMDAFGIRRPGHADDPLPSNHGVADVVQDAARALNCKNEELLSRIAPRM
jgi:hypothetical protein